MKSVCLAVVLIASLTATLHAGEPFKSELLTIWSAKVTPENAWTEYPRPELERSQWRCLNGRWDYAITPDEDHAKPTQWMGKILVPYALESGLGGVQRSLAPDEALWYRRVFQAARPENRRLLLNFEAVDYRCEVFVNDKSVGTHQGGSTPFSFDITPAVRAGDNELAVRVTDKTGGWQLHGKQVLKPQGIWYTQVSGIWQTVWLEEVAATHLADLKITTDIARGTVTIRPRIAGSASGASVKVLIKDGNEVVAEAAGTNDPIVATIKNAKLWSPASPHLYALDVSLVDARGKVLDRVRSYAGIRQVGKTRDASGNLRFTLNGKPLFHWGTLDQGWWPDGLLTPPSDEAMRYDIEFLKSAGFNMIRKHIKVEPRRYYYHCDRLGMLVWQDQVSGGMNPPWTRFKSNPVDANWPDAQHQQYMLELERMISLLENHPCIVVWVPFNEAWGQHQTLDVGGWLVKRDPSRLLNIASGGNFWRIGDIADAHNYPHPTEALRDDRYRDWKWARKTSFRRSFPRVSLRHRLEAVKVLPDQGANDPPDYGPITVGAVAKAEVESPHRRRVICMAITADDKERGLPTLWSAAIDLMCAGAMEDTRRIMIVAAGNYANEVSIEDYPEVNRNAGIQDPAQAWNVVTVGAYTEKVMIEDQDLAGYRPISATGSLSPRSTTSYGWDQREWPLKPDIVMEGGNYTAGPDGRVREVDDLSLLTTMISREWMIFRC